VPLLLDLAVRAVQAKPLLSILRKFALATVCLGTLFPILVHANPLEIEAQPIPFFQISSYGHTFGQLEYIGGIRMWSDDDLYGAVSSIRFKSDGKSFISVMDTGHIFTGQIERDSDGKLSGISSANIHPILNQKGEEPARKYMVDAEGLALRGDKAYVAFEQRHRIEIFDIANLDQAKAIGRLPHLIPDRELRANAGIETLVLAPEDSHLKGAMVAIAEQSIDDKGNLFAAVLEGPYKGLFSVAAHDDFAITDGAFLPGGDLLLLERRFNFPQGVGMRLRRIAGGDIKPGAVVDGEILLDVGMSYQIDNMEGLDVVAMPDGSTHLIIVSDNNHSFLQRNLMLEFKLLD
jgi:hypothetical protein